MSGDAEWDSEGWKTERDASLARKSQSAAAASGIRIGDTFLIATEGTVTEPAYFDLLVGALGIPRVKVLVVPGDASDPSHVIHTARRWAKRQATRARRNQSGLEEPGGYDHVWAVIDTDVAVRQGSWEAACKLADDHNVTLAQSTPCFEFWLLLHLTENPTTRADLVDGAAAKSAVKKELGANYSTNEKTARTAIASFIHKWPKAVRHAAYVRRHHEEAATPRPGNPSTDVDLLIRAINDSLRPESRKIR